MRLERRLVRGGGRRRPRVSRRRTRTRERTNLRVPTRHHSNRLPLHVVHGAGSAVLLVLAGVDVTDDDDAGTLHNLGRQVLRLLLPHLHTPPRGRLRLPHVRLPVEYAQVVGHGELEDRLPVAGELELAVTDVAGQDDLCHGSGSLEGWGGVVVAAGAADAEPGPQV